MNAKYGNVTTKILTVLLVLAMVMVARESAQFVSTLEENARRTLHKNGEEITIVVDAGHGGIDPGKIGVNNALEKDINLAIALKLERNLKENGIRVVMTRTDDNGLYKANDSNKKVRDMKNRLEIIEGGCRVCGRRWTGRECERGDWGKRGTRQDVRGTLSGENQALLWRHPVTGHGCVPASRYGVGRWRLGE